MAFQIFLQYLYSASVPDWSGCEVELLELADRYLVDSLRTTCEERLLQMDPDTALGILRQAHKAVISSEVSAVQCLSSVRHCQRTICPD